MHGRVKCDFQICELLCVQQYRDEEVVYYTSNDKCLVFYLLHAIQDRLVIIQGDPELSSEIQCMKYFLLFFKFSKAGTNLSVSSTYLSNSEREVLKETNSHRIYKSYLKCAEL